VAVEATARDVSVVRKRGGCGAGGGDQRVGTNGKEGAALDERARLHGARSP
jgi:hypothetical protein